MPFNDIVLSPHYDRAARVALALQLATAVVALLLMDQGRFARLYGILLAGFWIGAAMIAARRPFNPTTGDLAYWRWGTIPLLATTVLIYGLAS